MSSDCCSACHETRCINHPCCAGGGGVDNVFRGMGMGGMPGMGGFADMNPDSSNIAGSTFNSCADFGVLDPRTGCRRACTTRGSSHFQGTWDECICFVVGTAEAVLWRCSATHAWPNMDDTGGSSGNVGPGMSIMPPMDFGGSGAIQPPSPAAWDHGGGAWPNMDDTGSFMPHFGGSGASQPPSPAAWDHGGGECFFTCYCPDCRDPSRTPPPCCAAAGGSCCHDDDARPDTEDDSADLPRETNDEDKCEENTCVKLCDGPNACAGKRYVCRPNKNCLIMCSGQNACERLVVDCPFAPKRCDVVCGRNEKDTCAAIEVRGQHSGGLSFMCINHEVSGNKGANCGYRAEVRCPGSPAELAPHVGVTHAGGVTSGAGPCKISCKGGENTCQGITVHAPTCPSAPAASAAAPSVCDVTALDIVCWGESRNTCAEMVVVATPSDSALQTALIDVNCEECTGDDCCSGAQVQPNHRPVGFFFLARK